MAQAWRFRLRSIEIARLELYDLDWRAGEILARGKGDRLPLPVDACEPLVDHRRRRHAAAGCRQVFVLLKAH